VGALDATAFDAVALALEGAAGAALAARVAAGLAVAAGVGVAGFGVAGVMVAGFGVAVVAGGSILGGEASPGEPSSENDQPSTLPTGGVRVLPPSWLELHAPPRAAYQ